jgi:hypothetical protein
MRPRKTVVIIGIPVWWRGAVGGGVKASGKVGVSHSKKLGSYIFFFLSHDRYND